MSNFFFWWNEAEQIHQMELDVPAWLIGELYNE